MEADTTPVAELVSVEVSGAVGVGVSPEGELDGIQMESGAYVVGGMVSVGLGVVDSDAVSSGVVVEVLYRIPLDDDANPT
eukprot:gene6188-biopygen121